MRMVFLTVPYGMFHFMTLSAPCVSGPNNPQIYWFDPQTMTHVRALKALVDLVPFGPAETLSWDLGRSWDHFLAGRAALTFTWGDLDTFSNPLQFPYLRIPGAFAYWQALDQHLAEAAAGQLSPAAALQATAVDFEEITICLGRERQQRAYRVSLGL